MNYGEEAYYEEEKAEYKKEVKFIWKIICRKCPYTNSFESHVGVHFRDFAEILNRRTCPNCNSEIEIYPNEKTGEIIAKCPKCGKIYNMTGLKNVNEEVLKNKETAWVNIVPKCPECGEACNIYLAGWT